MSARRPAEVLLRGQVVNHARHGTADSITVGHSTRRWDEFVVLLQAWKIKEVVDVRTVARSRAYPWFRKELRRPYIACLG
jgi:hypothetical protein